MPDFGLALLIVCGAVLLIFGGSRVLAYFSLRVASRAVDRPLTFGEVSEVGPQLREVYADPSVLWQDKNGYGRYYANPPWMVYAGGPCSDTPASMNDIKLVRAGAGFQLYGHPLIPDKTMVGVK